MSVIILRLIVPTVQSFGKLIFILRNMNAKLSLPALHFTLTIMIPSTQESNGSMILLITRESWTTAMATILRSGSVGCFNPDISIHIFYIRFLSARIFLKWYQWYSYCVRSTFSYFFRQRRCHCFQLCLNCAHRYHGRHDHHVHRVMAARSFLHS